MVYLFHIAANFFRNWVGAFSMRGAEISCYDTGGVLCFVSATSDTAVDCASGSDR